jgi:RNA methyltransferase, TrmH family
MLRASCMSDVRQLDQRMARCGLTDGRCGRIGAPCRARQCIARTVRRLHDRRRRDKLGLFFVEGEDAIEAATAEPVELLIAGENVAPELLAEVSTAAHPPRVIGVYRRDDLPGAEARPVALELWGVADPGNLGTLIRSADAFGAAVVLTPGCADPTGPKALRASAGSLWRVPLLHRVIMLTRDDDDSRRVALVAHGGEPLTELDLRGAVTFLLGAERAGLPPEVPRDVEASIPISRAESLNVAAAGAVALYEWRRQNP